MNNSLLTQTQLFEGIRESEIEDLLRCLTVREKCYPKDAVIHRAGDSICEIGLVEAGSVNVIVHFYWGKANIFSHVGKGEIFGENYAAIPGKELVCDIVAAEDCRILFLDMDALLTTCTKGCAHHNRVIHNLLRIAAQKNLDLSSRMMHIAPKSIREKLLSYLSEQANAQGSVHFSIPFSRQQLADYLGVDRSALSAELGRMQRDGLIRYKKNDFTLIK